MELFASICFVIALGIVQFVNEHYDAINTLFNVAFTIFGIIIVASIIIWIIDLFS